MASGRIELEIGGKYGAGQMFAQAQKDSKDFARTHKDAMDAGRKAVDALSDAFGGQLAGSVKIAHNLLGDIARGGLWGAIGAVASQTIGFVVEKFTEMREAAQKAREACESVFRQDIADAAKSAAERFADTRKEMQGAKADATDLLGVLNGEVATRAENKAFQIKMDAINASIAERTAAEKAVADANTKYALAVNAGQSAVEQAKNRRDNAEKQLEESAMAVSKAESYLEEQTCHRAEMEAVYGGLLAERKELTDKIAAAEALYADGTLTLEQSQKLELGAKAKLIEFDEAHAKDMEQLNAAIKAEKDAAAAVEQAKRDDAAMRKEFEGAVRSLNTAEQNLAVTEAEMDVQRQKANQALEEERKELERRKQEEERAKQAAKEKADADALLLEQLEARAKAEQEAKEAAEREAAQKKSNIEQAVGRIDAKVADIQAAKDGVQIGMRAEQEHTTGLFGPYQYHTDSNGNIDNFIDFQRNRRFQERGERDAQWTARRDANWEDRIAKLRAKDPDKLTKSDRQKLDDWQAYKDQKEDESEWQKAADAIKGADGKSLSDLNALIETKFGELGLQ